MQKASINREFAGVFDAIKYDDLFEGNDSRERIMVFEFPCY